MLSSLRVQSTRSLALRHFSKAASLLPLCETDPELFDIIEKEKNRQRKHIELIASENYVSSSVLEALGSVLTNKYSEGYPGARYYGGNDIIDMSESLCRKRALVAYRLKAEEWGVNVQPLSGSPANFEVYTALLNPFDRMMSLDLPHGGHLSHGYEIPGKKVSAVSKYFQVVPYRLNEKTGRVDYDSLEKIALLYRPRLIVCGASAYPRHFDYKRIRKICDSVGAYMMTDMAHVSGLVAAGVFPSPFEHSHIVTTTTHKSLRGPRGAMIFFRRKGKDNFEEKINSSVFPGHQGGPHNHTIAALAAALKQAATPEFKEYATQVLKNSQQMASGLVKLGYRLISGGTDNHLCLLDARIHGLDGARLESTLESCSISANKNTIPGDKKALVPGGVRLGSPAVTSRGFVEKDMDRVVEFLHRAIGAAADVQKSLVKGSKLADFKAAARQAAQESGTTLSTLREEVEEFAKAFPVPGIDIEKMKYKD